MVKIKIKPGPKKKRIAKPHQFQKKITVNAGKRISEPPKFPNKDQKRNGRPQEIILKPRRILALNKNRQLKE